MFEYAKSRAYRSIAITLVFVMLFSVVNFSDIQIVFAEDDTNDAEETAEDYEPVHIKELISEREESKTVFLNEDGTKSMYLSGEAIRTKNEQGQWEDIDNSIVEMDLVEDAASIEEGFAFRNNVGEVDILFSEGIKDQHGLKLEDGQYTITFGALTAEGYAEKSQGRLTAVELELEQERQLALEGQPALPVLEAPQSQETIVPQPQATASPQPEVQAPADEAAVIGDNTAEAENLIGGHRQKL